MPNLSALLATLVLTNAISRQEAKTIEVTIKNRPIPDNWETIVYEIEKIIDRKLTKND